MNTQYSFLGSPVSGSIADRLQALEPTLQNPTGLDAVSALHARGIWIWVRPFLNPESPDPVAQMKIWCRGVTVTKEFPTISEAYESAVDYVLDFMLPQTPEPCSL